MKIQARKDIARIIREDRQAVDRALAKGVQDAMLRHKKADVPVVVERDRKVEWVKPDDVGF